MNKEQQEFLKGKIGKLLTWTTLKAIGIDIGEHKPGRKVNGTNSCSQCNARHYAKGLCQKHYVKERYSQNEVRNELGQHIGRAGKVLCDFPECKYDMVRRVRATDGKWYCSIHHNGEITGDTGTEL